MYQLMSRTKYVVRIIRFRSCGFLIWPHFITAKRFGQNGPYFADEIFNLFCYMKTLLLQLQPHLNLLSGFQSIICRQCVHIIVWSRKGHSLNQWWLISFMHVCVPRRGWVKRAIRHVFRYMAGGTPWPRASVTNRALIHRQLVTGIHATWHIPRACIVIVPRLIWTRQTNGSMEWQYV